VGNPFKAAGRGLKRAFGGGRKPERTFSNKLTGGLGESAVGEMRSERKELEPEPLENTRPEGEVYYHPLRKAAAESRTSRPLGKPAPVWKIAGKQVTRPGGISGTTPTTPKAGAPSTAVKDSPPFDWVDPAWADEPHKTAVREDRTGASPLAPARAPVATSKPAAVSTTQSKTPRTPFPWGRDMPSPLPRVEDNPASFAYGDEPYERENERIAKSNAAGRARLEAIKRMKAATEYGRQKKQGYQRMPQLQPAVSHIPQKRRDSWYQGGMS